MSIQPGWEPAVPAGGEPAPGQAPGVGAVHLQVLEAIGAGADGQLEAQHAVGRRTSQHAGLAGMDGQVSGVGGAVEGLAGGALAFRAGGGHQQVVAVAHPARDLTVRATPWETVGNQQ